VGGWRLPSLRKDKDRSFRQSSAVSCEPESSSRVTPETSAHFAQKVGEVRRRIRVPPSLGPDVGEAVAIRVRGRFRHRPPGQVGAETIGEPRGGAARQSARRRRSRPVRRRPNRRSPLHLLGRGRPPRGRGDARRRLGRQIKLELVHGASVRRSVPCSGSGSVCGHRWSESGRRASGWRRRFDHATPGFMLLHAGCR